MSSCLPHPGGKAEMRIAYIATDSTVTPYYHRCQISHELDLRYQDTKFGAEADGTAK